MERKNVQGKSGTGKVTRQITTLKTTLKHTTDNALMLEKSIGEKTQEVDDFMKKLEVLEGEAKDKEQQMFIYQMDNVLSKKMQKQINLSQILAMQNSSKVYDDLASNKYKASANSETLKTHIQTELAQEEKLKGILKDFAESKPIYKKVISMLLDWQ